MAAQCKHCDNLPEGRQQVCTPPWWTQIVSQAWAVKEITTKRWQMARKKKQRDNKTAVKLDGKRKATDNFKNIAIQSKIKMWESFLTQLGIKGNLRNFWNFHKNVNRRIVNSSISNNFEEFGNSLQTHKERNVNSLKDTLNLPIKKSQKPDRISGKDIRKIGGMKRTYISKQSASDTSTKKKQYHRPRPRWSTSIST